ncbi:MAG: VWA domain-containing protein [Luteitalea sp.]|nr:VWA domain-containing protein [Luteitalea sp.]
MTRSFLARAVSAVVTCLVLAAGSGVQSSGGEWSGGLGEAPQPAAQAKPPAAGQAPAQKPRQKPGQKPERKPQQPGGQERAGGEGQKQDPTFRTGVTMVLQDVQPRESRNGQFIADLKKDDFEVLEDGVEQEIVSFTLVHGGRHYNLLEPPPPPPQEGLLLPTSAPTNDAAGRIFILFVDDLHLDFRNTGRIRELFKKISTTLIHEGDMFAIVSTGPSSLAIDPTYDHKRLDDAIERISGSALRPNEIVEGPEGAQGPSEIRYRAHVAFSTAYDLVREFEKIQHRRKAFVYVSNGYDFDPFPRGRLKYQYERYGGSTGGVYDGEDINPEDPTAIYRRQGQQFADADLVRELAELTRACNRANVTMYTIDPRGLVGMPDLDENVDMTEFNDYIRKSQDSLRVIAEETGGFAVVNQNDFEKGLKRIDNETSDYYVLGYYTSNPDPTQRLRRIEVNVNRKNVNVWHRSSYTLRPEETSSQ